MAATMPGVGRALKPGQPSSDRWQYAKTKPTPGKVCIDCIAEGVKTKRSAPHPGPRCTTHHNAKRRDRRLARKIKHVENTYGLTEEQYDALYVFQGGRCALCPRTGTSGKRLAVDHDHHQAMLDGHAPDKGCPNCVRGLVCSTCNDVLAHARSNPLYGLLLAEYLTHWPWHRLDAGVPWPPRMTGV